MGIVAIKQRTRGVEGLSQMSLDRGLTVGQNNPASWGMDMREGMATVLAAVTDSAGVVTVNAFAPGRSALLQFHVRSRLDEWQLSAGMRLEHDLLVGAQGGSNAAAIEAHLLTSLAATPSQREAQAFGRVMRGRRAGGAGGSDDALCRKLDCAYRLARVRRHLPGVAWELVYTLIGRNMGCAEIAAVTGIDRHVLAGRLRDALSELSAAYDAAARDAMPKRAAA